MRLGAAGGISTMWSGASTVLNLLNLMPIPGLGLIVGMAIKFIYRDKPDRLAPYLKDNVIKPMIAAAEKKDYASVIHLAYKKSGDGYMPYELYFQCVSRWPKSAELFYTVMMGHAAQTNDWTQLAAFTRWLDRTYNQAVAETTYRDSKIPPDRDGRD